MSGDVPTYTVPSAHTVPIGGGVPGRPEQLPVVDTDRATVRYGDIFSLMRDLRAFGATNVLEARSRKPLARAILLRAQEVYAERFADPDGRLRATFETLWISGWAPHDNQPKPLKPGSATMRLEDALTKARGEPPASR